MTNEQIALAWLIFGAILIFLELVIPGLVVVFLGFGAMIVAAGWHIGLIDSWAVALLTWFISSLALLLGMRGLFQRLAPGRIKRGSTDEDADAAGKIVEVVNTVGPGDKEGRIRYSGTTWRARCFETEISAGKKAQIVYRNNQIWIVDPADPE